MPFTNMYRDHSRGVFPSHAILRASGGFYIAHVQERTSEGYVVPVPTTIEQWEGPYDLGEAQEHIRAMKGDTR